VVPRAGPAGQGRSAPPPPPTLRRGLQSGLVLSRVLQHLGLSRALSARRQDIPLTAIHRRLVPGRVSWRHGLQYLGLRHLA
jgi:hypothetical protein